MSGNRWPAPKPCGVVACMPRLLPRLILLLVPLLAIGCGSATLREVATERGARDATVAACLLAHTFDGQFGDELEVMRRFCGKREFLDPWMQEAADIRRLVMAQRAGKVRPDPEPSEPPAAE